MKVTLFSAKPHDRRFFAEANGRHGHQLNYLESRLTAATAPLAADSPAVCAFVNDQLDAEVLAPLAEQGTRLVALRSAGYHHVDLSAAARLGLTVVHVPRYSPHAVAEHTLGLILALNRRLLHAHNRVREGNFSIEGLLGFDLYGKTCGLIGAGRIGVCVGRILQGFGCRVLACDPHPSPEAKSAKFHFCETEELLESADIVSLHCPLTPDSRRLVDAGALKRMRRGAMLINTSRAALIDTEAAIAALLSGQIGYLGLDLDEEQAEFFDGSRTGGFAGDPLFSRLLALPNVLVTGHQAFFTREALATIAGTTLASVTAFANGRACTFALPPPATETGGDFPNSTI